MYSADDLAFCEPDAILPDLSDVELVLRAFDRL
jgi:hypothetical protein